MRNLPIQMDRFEFVTANAAVALQPAGVTSCVFCCFAGNCFVAFSALAVQMPSKILELHKPQNKLDRIRLLPVHFEIDASKELLRQGSPYYRMYMHAGQEFSSGEMIKNMAGSFA
uniref:Uncharacterized protein n=1 Tax=Romanomermis culicivorax TaxID=13658 RepID=A0A915KL10_ROMCU